MCRAAYVCHCAAWLADSLADSRQVAVRVVVSAAREECLRLCKLPRSALQRIATRLTTVRQDRREAAAHILADLEAIEPLLRATPTVEIGTTIPVTEVADTFDEAVARQADAKIRRAFRRSPTALRSTSHYLLGQRVVWN